MSDGIEPIGAGPPQTGPALTRHELAGLKRSANPRTPPNPAPSAAPTGTTAVPLTDGERAEFARCEAIIDNNLPPVAEALHTILQRRLYREHYSSFEAYCEQRWGMSRVHGYRLARVHPIRTAAAAALQEISAGDETNWLQTHTLPAEEAVYRALPATLSPEVSGGILADLLVEEPDPTADQVRVYIADLVRQGDRRVVGIKIKSAKHASSRPAIAGSRSKAAPAPDLFHVIRHFDVLIDGNVRSSSQEDAQKRIHGKWLASRLDEILTTDGMECRVEVTDAQPIKS